MCQRKACSAASLLHTICPIREGTHPQQVLQAGTHKCSVTFYKQRKEKHWTSSLWFHWMITLYRLKELRLWRMLIGGKQCFPVGLVFSFSLLMITILITIYLIILSKIVFVNIITICPIWVLFLFQPTEKQRRIKQLNILNLGLWEHNSTVLSLL